MKTGTPFLFVILLFITPYCFSQGSTLRTSDSYFSIEKLGTTYSQDDLFDVFSRVDYCGMLNPNLSYTITLNDSSLVRIYAMSQLKEITLPPSCLRENDVVEEANWLIKEGVLIKMIEAKHTK